MQTRDDLGISTVSADDLYVLDTHQFSRFPRAILHARHAWVLPGTIERRPRRLVCDIFEIRNH